MDQQAAATTFYRRQTLENIVASGKFKWTCKQVPGTSVAHYLTYHIWAEDVTRTGLE